MCGFLLCILLCFAPSQDQLSADMYSFVAKEIDYATTFQTVSIQKGERLLEPVSRCHSGDGRNLVLESSDCQACPENRWGFDYPTCE